MKYGLFKRMPCCTGNDVFQPHCKENAELSSQNFDCVVKMAAQPRDVSQKYIELQTSRNFLCVDRSYRVNCTLYC